MQAERQKAEAAMRPAAMQRAGYWFLIGASNFKALAIHNHPDPKHRPHVGFRRFDCPIDSERRSGPKGPLQLQSQPIGNVIARRSGPIVIRSFSAAAPAPDFSEEPARNCRPEAEVAA
jgi:hypothetical protein